MTKFLVQNLTDRPVKLGIEPWADLEILAPKGRADFEYQEPAELGVALMKDGVLTVSILSDHIRVTANGSEKIFMPPPGWRSIDPAE